MVEQNHFSPAHLMLFTVISMQTRIISSAFIQIPMTRAQDPVDWRDHLRSQAAQVTTQTQAEQNLLIQLLAKNHEPLKSLESRTCSVERDLYGLGNILAK